MTNLSRLIWRWINGDRSYSGIGVIPADSSVIRNLVKLSSSEGSHSRMLLAVRLRNKELRSQGVREPQLVSLGELADAAGIRNPQVTPKPKPKSNAAQAS